MGAFLSNLIWSEEQTQNNNSKYTQGIGNTVEKSNRPIPKKGDSRNVRKRPKGKFNKSMIGNPGNFQHTAHLGATEMKTGEINIADIKKQMSTVTPITTSKASTTTATSVAAAGTSSSSNVVEAAVVVAPTSEESLTASTKETI